MTFTEFGPTSRANVPEHNRLRGLDQGDPHPQYADSAHAHTPSELPTLLEVFDTSNALTGTPPAASTGGFLVQVGDDVAPGASPFTITFPTPFPNGVVAVVACFGDSAGVSTFYTTNVSTTSFDFVSGAVVAHRVNWIAIGW